MASLPEIPEKNIIEDAFRPYVLAIGNVAHSWNRLQEELAKLFCAVTGLDNSMGLGIWHALKSDRSQRDLLEAAIKVGATWQTWSTTYPTACADLLWIIERANKVADQRNDAIHAPCTMLVEF